jgi:hypothetical protein
VLVRLYRAFAWQNVDKILYNINKEMFPVYGGECLSRKAVHSWVANVSLIMKRLKQRFGNG